MTGSAMASRAAATAAKAARAAACLRLPAVYMRGGTSKGVFLHARDLPCDPAARDQLLLRLMGSPDPYGKQIDGMGGATSTTSKVAIIQPSSQPDCDVDYTFGQVAIDRPLVDWTGGCGNMAAAVGPFALTEGLVRSDVRDGVVTVKIWQTNLRKRIVAHVPVRDGEVAEAGDFELDGVAFRGAEIRMEFLNPGGESEDGQDGAPQAMFPTGNVVDTLEVPGVGSVPATLITAGNATVFVPAAAVGLRGNERQSEVNCRPELLKRLLDIRAYGALAMGAVRSIEEARTVRLHTPKIAFVSPPQEYTASNGRHVPAAAQSLTARILSMGTLHHAMTGTGAVAIAAAAAVPGTVVRAALADGGRGAPPNRLVIGHPSGLMEVSADATQLEDGSWDVARVTMSRTARRLMEGWIRVPAADVPPAAARA